MGFIFFFLFKTLENNSLLVIFSTFTINQTGFINKTLKHTRIYIYIYSFIQRMNSYKLK